MLKNYLKIAFRNLQRHKLYVAVNVLGIGLALACCIIAYLNFKFDRSFDAFHEKKDSIFRVDVISAKNDQLYGVSPLPLADAMEKDVAGIEQASRYYERMTTVKKEKQVNREQLTYADDNFFQLFDFPFQKGTPEALSDRSQVIITQSAAEKYFGTEDPIGKDLIVDAGKDYQKSLTVGGVLEDIPLNSSIQFELLTHIDNLIIAEKAADFSDWARFASVTFVQLKNPEQAPEIAELLGQYTPIQNEAREDFPVKAFYLESLNGLAHHAEQVRSNYLQASLPVAAVWSPVIMVILLLLTACLNFANTSIATSNRRLKEMGVRKVMGGTKKQLIGQLLAESLFISVLALIVGLLLVDLLLPKYNAMWTFLDLEANYLSNPGLITFIIATLLGTTLIAGAYPAFYISAFNPVNIFRGGVKFGGSNLFSRLMMGVQVTISLVAVIAAFTFSQNASFQKNADLGYQREGIIGVPLAEPSDYELLVNQIGQNPKIEAFAGTQHQIGYVYRGTEMGYKGEPYDVRYMEVGEGYLNLMDVGLVEGRLFDAQLETDYKKSVLVNERLAAMLNTENPIDQKVTLDSVEYQVIGVVEDFYQGGFFNPLDPVVIRYTEPENYHCLVVKTNPEELVATNLYLQSAWNQLFPFKPYAGFFQDEVLAGEMTVNANIKDLFIFFAIITLLLAVTGLFALVSLNVLKRRKEIAIRKIVGATLGNIAILINRNYLWIFIIAAILGSAGGYWLTQMLLDSIYATHIGVSTLAIAISSIGIFVMVSIIVGIKVVRIGNANPSTMLRSE